MKRQAELLIAVGTAVLSQVAFAQQTTEEFAKKVKSSIEKFSNSTGIVITKGVRRTIVSAGPPKPYRVSRRRRRRKAWGRNHSDSYSWSPSYWFSPTITSLLQKYPIISLVVRPVPPMDYIVRINGEAYPATSKSQYAVSPGHVALKIERSGQKPCEWNEDVDKNETVTCDFSQTDAAPSK